MDAIPLETSNLQRNTARWELRAVRKERIRYFTPSRIL
jgi:hypothetical protein